MYTYYVRTEAVSSGKRANPARIRLCRSLRGFGVVFLIRLVIPV